VEYRSQAQREVHDRITPFVRDLFGSCAQAQPDVPGWSIAMGSSLVHVLVLPWGAVSAVIVNRAYVVTDAELTPDLMRFLLDKNDSVLFGSFGVDGDGDIFFGHTLYGPSCDQEELEYSVRAVLSVADEADDEIRSRWGGRRALDRAR